MYTLALLILTIAFSEAKIENLPKWQDFTSAEIEKIEKINSRSNAEKYLEDTLVVVSNIKSEYSTLSNEMSEVSGLDVHKEFINFSALYYFLQEIEKNLKDSTTSCQQKKHNLEFFINAGRELSPNGELGLKLLGKICPVKD